MNKKKVRKFFCLMGMGIILSLVYIQIVPLQKVKAAESVVVIYHTHKGDTQTPGACYQQAYSCGSTSYSVSSYSGGCTSACWYDPNWGKMHNGHVYHTTSVCNTCGYSYGEVVGDYEMPRNQPCTNIKYSRSCGLEENTPVASLEITPSTTQWTNQPIVLTGNLQVMNPSFEPADLPFCFNGESFRKEATIPIVQNGTYTFQVKGKNDSNTAGVTTASITITNIDNEPPKVMAMGYVRDGSITTTLPQTYGRSQTIGIQVKDSTENPLGGVSGFSPNPVSVDGGATWVPFTNGANGIYTLEATSNNPISFLIRDQAGNQVTYNQNGSNFQVAMIDKEGPMIEEITQNIQELTNQKVMFTVIAKDNQSGIGGSAYSFDEGNTWHDSNAKEVSVNGTYSVIVRDRLGNTTRQTIKISNIDKTLGKIEPVIVKKEEPIVSKTGSEVADPKKNTNSGKTKGTDTNKNKKSEQKTSSISKNGITKGTISTNAVSQNQSQSSNQVISGNTGLLKNPTTSENIQIKSFGEEDGEEESVEVLSNEVASNLREETVQGTMVKQTQWKTFLFGMLVPIGMVVFLFIAIVYGMLKTVCIYAKDVDQIYRYIGRGWIKRKNGSCQITLISKSMYSVSIIKCKLVFFSLFVAFHKDQEISILLPNETITKGISKEVLFQWNVSE